MTEFLRLPALVWRLLLAAALVAVCLMSQARAAACECASADAHRACVHTAPSTTASWIFARSRYTHDPDTGGRVAQYAMKPPVEPLPDQRAVTSGYSRTRTVLRGGDGSANTIYRVQSFGNGRGGLDAEWERFHDAWRGSTLAGGNFQTWGQSGYGAVGGFGGFPGYGQANIGPGGVFPPSAFQPGFGGPPPYGPGEIPGFGRPGGAAGFPYPGYRGRLDPDGADGHRDGNHRTPDRRFFNQAVPMPAAEPTPRPPRVPPRVPEE